VPRLPNISRVATVYTILVCFYLFIYLYMKEQFLINNYLKQLLIHVVGNRKYPSREQLNDLITVSIFPLVETLYVLCSTIEICYFPANFSAEKNPQLLILNLLITIFWFDFEFF
jgi:hypothetical protein